MVHNFGKMHFRPVTVSVETEEGMQKYDVHALYDENGVEWHSLVKEHPHPFYIAIDDNGRVISMEQDPELSQVDATLIGIQSDHGYSFGMGGNVYGKEWDGEKIVEPRKVVPQTLDHDQFKTMLEVNGHLERFAEVISMITPAEKMIMLRNRFNNGSTKFDIDSELMALVAPIIWGDEWKEVVSPMWERAKGY